MTEKKPQKNRKALETTQKIARVIGICLVVPFFVWLPLGLVPMIPSIVDIFGMSGLRIPTGIVIAGLMLAAFGFEDI